MSFPYIHQMRWKDTSIFLPMGDFYPPLPGFEVTDEDRWNGLYTKCYRKDFKTGHGLCIKYIYIYREPQFTLPVFDEAKILATEMGDEASFRLRGTFNLDRIP